MSELTIGVVIPVLNEEGSIAKVLGDLPPDVDYRVVVDNGSTDQTARIATEAGATVLNEDRRGYGYACTKGIEYLNDRNVDVIVFLDGDYSDYPDELSLVVKPIIDGEADFVIGSRVTGNREPGALLPQALFGNVLAGILMKLFWGYRFTDLGPFRAIRADVLAAMEMKEFTYGWTVEMQIKAAKMGIRSIEVPVRYRRRIGKSKVTGTLSGTIRASIGILRTLFRHRFSRSLNP